MIASTPPPPYTAVIFTSLRNQGDGGYAAMAARMGELAAQQPGYLGIESARDGLGITVSYWVDEAAAQAWKQVTEHLVAQERGRAEWYADYQVRIATVTRSYGPDGPRYPRVPGDSGLSSMVRRLVARHRGGMTTTKIPAGSVVVAYDGSDHSQQALRWAVDEADRGGRPLAIVTVVATLAGYETISLAAMAGVWVPSSEAHDALCKHAQDELDKLELELHVSAPDLPVTTAVLEGDAREVLVALSRTAHSLFLGNRGRGAVKSLLLGSVSVEVSRAALCPVFIVRPEQAGERNGVLVGTDCGEATRTTLEFAYREASLRDLPLTVLYCVGGVEAMYGITGVMDDDEPGYDDERRELAETVAGLGEQYPDVDVRPRLARGSVEVCLIKESAQSDLLVIGHHAGPAIGDLLHLGSFVAPVVENAHCTVAIVVDRATAE